MVRSHQNLPRRHWSTFDLTNPPQRVYRVHYSGAGTYYSSNGFQARDQGSVSDYTNADMHERLKRHFNWTKDSNCESPMISTFGSLAHAQNWARKWSNRHPRGTYHIATIEVTDNLYVFRAVELVNVFDVPLSGTAIQDQLRDEYLIFRRIDSGSNVLYFEDEDGDYVHRSRV